MIYCNEITYKSSQGVRVMMKALQSATKKMNRPVGVLPENEKLRKEFNIDAFHGTNQQVAINPVITKDGRRVLVEEDYQPIKEFIDKGEYEGDTPSIQDIGNWFSEDPKLLITFQEVVKMHKFIL